MKIKRLSRKTKRKIQKISIVLICVLIFGMALLVWHSRQETLATELSYEQYIQTVAPLYNQLNELEKELSNLEQEYSSSITPKSTSQIVFTELDTRVYDLCFQPMKQRKLTGVLALSEKELPGNENCITMEQFQELINAGWTTCIYVNEYTDVPKYLSSFSEKLTELEIETPKVLYVADGLYSFESKLDGLDFDIVIYEGSNNSSVIQTSIGTKVWWIGSVGLNSPYPQSLLSEAVECKGNLAFLVGFTKRSERYISDYFINMIDVLENYISEDRLMVCSPQDAKEHFTNRTLSRNDLQQEEYNIKKAELENNINEIKKKIDNAFYQSN